MTGATTDADPTPTPARRPALLALLLQIVAALLALALHRLLLSVDIVVPPAGLAVLQGLLAVGLSVRFGQSRWWTLLHAIFGPALLAASVLRVSAGWWLAGAVLLALFHWNSVGERVPLYLTGRRTEEQIVRVLDTLSKTVRFVDLGCGLAGMLCRLARRYPMGQFVGVETAPLVFLLAWLRSAFVPNCHIRYRSLWDEPLDAYDAVYCFLSPAPMPRLWKKVQAELRPGALLISNTFEVPGAVAQETIDLEDWRRSRLLVYRR